MASNRSPLNVSHSVFFLLTSLSIACGSLFSYESFPLNGGHVGDTSPSVHPTHTAHNNVKDPSTPPVRGPLKVPHAPVLVVRTSPKLAPNGPQADARIRRLEGFQVAGQCNASTLAVQVGFGTLTLPVPSLRENQVHVGNCTGGYTGTIEVSCLLSSLLVLANRCRPSGCATTQTSSVRIGPEGQVTPVQVPRSLNHGQDAYVPCGSLLGGYAGHVWLWCSMGTLHGDASGCRPSADSTPSMWRVANADELQSSWRVAEVSFFTGKDCANGKLEGVPVADSEDVYSGDVRYRAFDGNPDTFWASRCNRSGLTCPSRSAWVGLALNYGSAKVRCVRLLQSQAACCSSRFLLLEMWSGEDGWLTTQVWDTALFGNSSEPMSLVVPAVCDPGPLKGVGVVHNCRGPPGMGFQAGQVCKVGCLQGFYGQEQELTCLDSGQFSGGAPTCVDLAAVAQIMFWVAGVCVLTFLAAQYKRWCMFKKARLTELPGFIPDALRGRWLEQDNIHSWDVLLKERFEKKTALEVDPEQAAKAMDDSRKEAEKEAKKATQEQMKQEKMLARNHAGTMMFNQIAEGMRGPGHHRHHHEEEGEAEIPVVVDPAGLWSPCEDPDIFCSVLCCSICRGADTWHTIGSPSWVTYWKVMFLYILCPCCCPCINYYGRQRVRQTFGLELQPHYDCLIYCCCCCLCAPCAGAQEARLVDAPVRLHRTCEKYASVITYAKQHKPPTYY